MTDAGHIGDWPAYAVGYVVNADPSEYGVAVYVQVNGYWWTKPYWRNYNNNQSPITPINPYPNWTCLITTGGIDQQATKVRAYLWKLADGDPPKADGTSTEIPIDPSVLHAEIDRTAE